MRVGVNRWVNDYGNHLNRNFMNDSNSNNIMFNGIEIGKYPKTLARLLPQLE